MTRSFNIFSLVLLLELSCAPGRDVNGLRSELARESRTHGVAIAGVLSGTIAVIPFDGKERFFETHHKRAFEAFAKYGHMIAWAASSIADSQTLVFEDMNGRQFRPTHTLPAQIFRVTAFNERCDKLAFQTGSTIADGPVHLYWSTMNLTDISFISEQPQKDVLNEMDWSPEGNELVYEKNGEIFVFDVTKQTSRVICWGHDPTWSPTSAAIAYRELDGQASLVSPGGVKKSWPIGDHNVLGPLRWSPDGLYVSFVEKNSRHLPLIGAYSSLIVARVSDGATFSVRGFGAGNGHSQIFHWIIQYQSFCKDCPHGEGFN